MRGTNFPPDSLNSKRKERKYKRVREATITERKGSEGRLTRYKGITGAPSKLAKDPTALKVL